MKSRYLQTNITRSRKVLSEKGLLYILDLGFNHMFSKLLAAYYRNFRNDKISFADVKLPYFFHHYNHTWLNERVIEIPIIYHLVENFNQENKCILEVGNVLSHYYNVKHDIVDKYEIKEEVITEDIISYYPKKKYDLIISISTLEHVGWDEIPKCPEKIFKAFEHMKSLLKNEGKMYITLPIGENPFLDRALRNGQIKFDKQYNYKRTSKTKWQNVEWNDIVYAQHNRPFRFGNAMIIGYVTK